MNRGPNRPAVFLDRDGTVIEHVHYLSDPAAVRPIPGAAEALRGLQGEGYALVVVTNQSAIGRGLLSVEQLERVNAEMDRRFALEGVAFDGLYYCPEVPTGDDPTAITHPDRKPAPGMLLRAAADLEVDLAASWMVGDMISDVLAGINAGCRRSIMVRTGKGFTGHRGGDGPDFDVVADLPAAARLILTSKAETR